MQEFTGAHQERFDRLLYSMRAGTVSTREHLWELTKKAYAEPHRAYHTAQHVIECLEHFDRHADSFGISLLDTHEFLAMEFAIWWHDLVYNISLSPSVLTNEALSAAYASSTLYEAGVHHHVVRLIHQLILVTDHKRKVTGLDAWMVDIDMAILGADEKRFDEYEQQVLFEYTRVIAHEHYLLGRLQFLRTLLERKRHHYQTDAFRDMYEERARNNIQRLIKQLEAEEANS